MVTTSTDEGIRDATLQVLTALGVEEVEMEVSLLELDHLVELAQGGQVQQIDTGDPAGGFGGADLWVATVVPIMAGATTLRRSGALSVPALDEAIDDALERVGSPKARKDKDQLVRAVRTALGIAFAREHR